MVDEERAEKESEVGGKEIQSQSSKRPLFSNISRQLTDKQLETPTAKVFLLAEIDRLDDELKELKKFRDDYFKVDMKRAILEHKLSVSNSRNGLFDICLAIGSALVGVAPGFWSTGPYGQIVLGFGITLILIVVFSKYAVLFHQDLKEVEKDEHPN